MHNFQAAMREDALVRCECLVIGSGAGGALTAGYLSKKGKEVLLLEEGPDGEAVCEDASITKTMPALWREGGIIPLLSNVKMVYAEGRCLGGSTMINAGLIHRTPESVAEYWSSAFQIADLDYRSLQTYHETIERELQIQVPAGEDSVVARLLKDGARRCGFTGSDTPEATTMIRGRRRKNDAKRTYINEAVKRGVRVITNCRAVKIHMHYKGAGLVDAVCSDAQGVIRRFHIQCETLCICAGPVQTALLLRKSGVKKNVGDSVQFHPTLRVVAEFDRPVHASSVAMPSFQVHEFAPEIKMGASVSTPAYMAASLSANWEANKRSLRNLNTMASFYVSTTCDANGMVRNVPLLDSSYIIRYKIHERALRNLSFGFAKLAEMLFASGAKRLYPAVEGLLPIRDQRDSDRFLTTLLPSKSLNLLAIHAFSSCPMGENTDRCAVDSFGRLHGYKNIMINDASMLPSSPGVNPQGPLMAVVLRNLEANFG